MLSPECNPLAAVETFYEGDDVAFFFFGEVEFVKGKGLVVDLDAQTDASTFIIKIHYFFQRGKYTVMHVRCRAGGIADGGCLKGVVEAGDLYDAIAAGVGIDLVTGSRAGYADDLGLDL